MIHPSTQFRPFSVYCGPLRTNPGEWKQSSDGWFLCLICLVRSIFWHTIMPTKLTKCHVCHHCSIQLVKRNCCQALSCVGNKETPFKHMWSSVIMQMLFSLNSDETYPYSQPVMYIYVCVCVERDREHSYQPCYNIIIPVNALMARIFGVWTLLSAVIRIYCAYDIKNRAWVVITYLFYSFPLKDST